MYKFLRSLANQFFISTLFLATLAYSQEGATSSAETTANPYGLEAVWQQGDWVARGTLLVLLFMSGISWSRSH
jgi:biopolymer transport protein ExbB